MSGTRTTVEQACFKTYGWKTGPISGSGAEIWAQKYHSGGFFKWAIIQFLMLWDKDQLYHILGHKIMVISTHTPSKMLLGSKLSKRVSYTIYAPIEMYSTLNTPERISQSIFFYLWCILLVSRRLHFICQYHILHKETIIRPKKKTKNVSI